MNTFSNDFSTDLTPNVEYEIRLRGGDGTAEANNIGNEVVVGLVTAGAGHPSVSQDFNVSSMESRCLQLSGL